MKPIEWLLLAAGAALISRFLLNSGIRYAGGALDRVAHRRAEELRDDFFLVSSRKVLLALSAAGFSWGVVAYAVTGSVWGFLFAVPTPAILSGTIARRYRVRRVRKVVSQLPGFLEAIGGHVKAGQSLPESLNASLPLLPSGIREEVAWICRLTRLGMPLSEAFRAWEERIPSPEISLIARPIRIALSSGGNLAALIDRSRDAIRTLQRQQEKLRAMTAQARLQAAVLTLLPPGFLLVLTKIQPGFLEACTRTTVGKAILAIAATLQFLGWVLIRRILAVRP